MNNILVGIKKDHAELYAEFTALTNEKIQIADELKNLKYEKTLLTEELDMLKLNSLCKKNEKETWDDYKEKAAKIIIDTLFEKDYESIINFIEKLQSVSDSIKPKTPDAVTGV